MTPEEQVRYDQLEKAKQRAIEVREQAIELSKKLGFRTKGRKAQRECELWIATAEIEQRKLREGEKMAEYYIQLAGDGRDR